MKRSSINTYLFIVVTLFYSSIINGQTIELIVDNETSSENSLGIKINLILKDTLINLKIGQNSFSNIKAKECKAIQIIYLTDTINFFEIFDYAEGTNEILLKMKREQEPDYTKILNTNWSIIIDKTPCRNKFLAKQIHKTPESKLKGNRIIALKAYETSWVFTDSKK